MSRSPSEDLLAALQDGELSPQGKFLWGSNYTFLVDVIYNDQKIMAVYKPVRGERPLWDFPSSSLAGREVAAYQVSQALGWNLVPPTVFRRDGPQGAGSLQFFIEHDSEYHYFNFSETDRQRLRPVVLFDLLINNADRKGSHVLFDQDGDLWLIDHGICFHSEYKLRTVIWDFAGESYSDGLCEDLTSFSNQLDMESDLKACLGMHLNPEEMHALIRRAEQLLSVGHFPNPRPNFRPYPWPPI